MKVNLSTEIPNEILLDTDFFISYYRKDELINNVKEILALALENSINLFISSEIFNDIISAYRSKGYSFYQIKELLLDLYDIPFKVLPVDLDIAYYAIEYYEEFGGSRKLHYYDSFHVATAKKYEKIFLTSDKFILKNQEMLNIQTIDLRKIV